ncbi:MAG: NAD(P)H-dependent oxidoreductase [Pseudomonadota bacterium]|nr:NAD(P)H-dependent oxidoreductase [Pseudomonadota bacterium]
MSRSSKVACQPGAMPAARPKKNHGNSAPIPVFIVRAHHKPKSFNGALTEAARQALLANGHEVRISDLYAMDFDPISDRRKTTKASATRTI